MGCCRADESADRRGLNTSPSRSHFQPVPVIPDFEWYSEKSREAKLSPRCPIAHCELCPRYYASVWLLGKARLMTEIAHADQQRLDKKWEPFKSTVAEEDASMTRAGEKSRFNSVSNFCPEVSKQMFGYFASGLIKHFDEIDREAAHVRLEREKADPNDPRWVWASMIPRHYTECREFSIFSEVADGKPLVGKASKKSQRKSRRTGLSQKVRWQVLARDSFTCQYCGRKPPDVVLEVDHMTSVADGGSDEMSNLTTACFECNRGKGPLSSPRSAV